MRITGFNGFTSNQVRPELPRQATTSSLHNKYKGDSKPFRNNAKLEEYTKSDIGSNQKILEKVLNNAPPKNFKRKNVLIGENTLYGLINKKLKIFGQDLEETGWESINNLPNGVFELDGHKIRIYPNKRRGIRAIEILETVEKIKNPQPEKMTNKAETDYNKWTVKQLKEFCSNNEINVRSSYRKAEIVKLIKEFQKKKE